MVKASKLDEISCASTTWPSKIVSFKDEDEKKIDHFEVRESARQLKLAMGSHHDRVNELMFHSLEMRAYTKLVWKEFKKGFWKPRRWNDLFSLLGGLTNKFGMDWLLPIILFVCTLSVNYLLILWSHLGDFSEAWNCGNWTTYFNLYIPTHSLSDLNLNGEISGWTAGWNFLSRIVSAFFLYQIVTAFRKFRK